MKKVRKFAEGGRFDPDTYERARAFLRRSGAEAETSAPELPSTSKQRAPAYSRPRVKGDPAKDLGITQEAVSRDQDQFSPRFGSDTYAKALNVLLERGIGYDSNQATLDALQDARRNEQKSAGKKAGGMVGSASKRADGCATRGKTRGKMV